MTPVIGSSGRRYGESPGLVSVQSLSKSSKFRLWPFSSTAEALPNVPVSSETFSPLRLAADMVTSSLSPLRLARSFTVRAWSAPLPLGQRTVTFWSGPTLWSTGSALASRPWGVHLSDGACPEEAELGAAEELGAAVLLEEWLAVLTVRVATPPLAPTVPELVAHP